MKAVVLRKPLEGYVEQDYQQELKSKEKKVLPLFNLYALPSLFKRDDDDEEDQEGGPQNPSFYNNYIL